MLGIGWKKAKCQEKDIGVDGKPRGSTKRLTSRRRLPCSNASLTKSKGRCQSGERKTGKGHREYPGENGSIGLSSESCGSSETFGAILEWREEFLCYYE